MRDKFNTMQAKWENEKNAIGRVQKLREEIEKLNRQIEEAEQNYDLEHAAELKYGKLPELQSGLWRKPSRPSRTKRARIPCCGIRSRKNEIAQHH